MRSAHEAQIVKISVQMSLISTKGDFSRRGIEIPIFGEERASSMVLSSLLKKEIVTTHTAARLCCIDINRYAQYWEM